MVLPIVGEGRRRAASDDDQVVVDVFILWGRHTAAVLRSTMLRRIAEIRKNTPPRIA